MGRQQLIAEIRAHDLSLDARRQQLQLDWHHRIAALQRIPPLQLLAGGAAAGLAAGLLEALVVRTGAVGLYPLCQGGVRLWRLSAGLLPLLSESCAGGRQ